MGMLSKIYPVVQVQYYLHIFSEGLNLYTDFHLNGSISHRNQTPEHNKATKSRSVA